MHFASVNSSSRPSEITKSATAHIHTGVIREHRENGTTSTSNKYSAVFRGGGLRVPPPEIVAAPQSTALGIPTAVHRNGERIYLMLLATQVVVKCSILRSKFTKNSFVDRAPRDSLGSLQRAPQTSS